MVVLCREVSVGSTSFRIYVRRLEGVSVAMAYIGIDPVKEGGVWVERSGPTDDEALEAMHSYLQERYGTPSVENESA
jgi:hypothetical protein